MKAELILKSPDRQDSFPLSGERVTMGRGMNVHIRVHDQLTSREHCEVVRMGERWVLRDLESSNGTRVNGQSVTEKVLEWGDRIEIGETTLLFVGESQSKGAADVEMAPANEDETKTRIVKAGELDFKSACQEKGAGEYAGILYEIEKLAATRGSVREFCNSVLRVALRGRRFGRSALLLFDASAQISDRFTRVEKEHSQWRINIDPGHLRKVSGGDAVLGRYERVNDGNFTFVIVPVRGQNRIHGALYVDDLIAIDKLRESDLPLLAMIGHVIGLRIEVLRELGELRGERETLRREAPPDGETPPLGTKPPV